MTIRERIEDVGDLSPALAAVLAIVMIALLAGVVWGLLRLPDHTRLRSPEARERARRREKSRKRQRELRRRRESLQRRKGRG
ncbi:hypothetical protein [Streptomyces sp. KAU_LT]|uniref:hypothetical protein n=1 Tax=Streptomyces sp. KAU_LT TaxID=3046669 RepID=UPI0024B83751|nr:hypothetical protein [Streptomyces sp. KAU_LT]MDI9830143.1 hypothetical protein [Streptomyces sp. KAU_LT]